MKLRRLEIIGFKSFFDKTVVSFEKDITSIVGPNGCGKSNIVDAIRWVMGEQSAKHLRGKNMEDVIFGGSEARAPLSMAGVDLTFSTEGYQTPACYLNHSEISICRRLYRTGESEYFINKVPSRLKDITDLFLGTGVGTKAYSIIEQGRVGQIVTAKPEDRRYFIEEVAGISKFKARKEAALRKMEATQNNLLRLTDIVTELERQMKSLERAARKAERYRAVKAEFQKCDLAFSATEYANDNDAQLKAEKDLRRFDEETGLLAARLQEGENSLEEGRVSLLESERKIQGAQNDLFEVTNYCRLAEASLRFKKEENENIVKRIQELTESAGELQKEITGRAQGLCQINEQKFLADFEEETGRENFESAESEACAVQKVVVGLEGEVEELRSQIVSAESRLAQITTLRQNLLQRSEELARRVETDEKERGQIRKQHGQIQKICNEAEGSLASLKQLKFDLTVQTDALAVELKQLRENLKREEQNLFQLKEELNLRKSRLISLEELQKNFEGYQEGTRSVLLKKDELGSDGIFGTVADFVETPPEFEGAVSAVLGEKLQYIVVKSQSAGLEAVDYLKTAAVGRTSFIPMEVRNYSADSGEIPEQEGVMGPLRQFVKVHGNFDHLAEFLFGDVVLVKNLNKALDVWQKNGHRKTLVTLDGEVVDPSGVISGGSLAGTSKVLLEKKREMKELGAHIENLESKLRDKEAACRELAGRVSELEAGLEAVKNSSVEEEIRVASQEKDLSHFRKEIDSLALKEQELAGRIVTEQEGLAGIVPEINSLNGEEEQLKKSWDESRNQLEEKRKALEAGRQEYAGLSEKLTGLKISLAQSGEKRAHLEGELARLQEEKIRTWDEWNLCRKEMELAAHRQAFLEKETTHIHKVLDKKLARKATGEADLSLLRERHNAETGAIREREAELKELRLEQNEKSEKLNQITVALTEIRGRMKYAVEQCLERHQLNLSEIYGQHADAALNLEEAREQVTSLREALTKLGDVNTAAFDEYEELKARYEFMKKQHDDLETSLKTLERVIAKINQTSKERFAQTFEMVGERFQAVFPKLFKGGKARLVLTDENNMLETGVEIVAQPPGKKLQNISLLSGGEKALTAVALIFSIFQIKPSPFCILDEVDAPLDDNNVDRYNDMLREMTNKTQFIVITHNKRTMEMADVLYGVTMPEAGVSQLVSVQLN